MSPRNSVLIDRAIIQSLASVTASLKQRYGKKKLEEDFVLSYFMYNYYCCVTACKKEMIVIHLKRRTYKIADRLTIHMSSFRSHPLMQS